MADASKDALTPAQVKLLQKTLPSSSPSKDVRNYKGKKGLAQKPLLNSKDIYGA
tara:strand:- start:223 stop:384 length:162 start_codon:yes stop_codon:yes gene_type:complete